MPPASLRLANILEQFAQDEWGFTGTRAGMRPFQSMIVRRSLSEGKPIVFRHGGAFGADFEAHAIWRETCQEQSIANVWPADEKRAALFTGQLCVRVEPVMPPLERNVEIVKRSVFLLAAPHTEHEEQRSGTWATIRAAFRINLPVLIIWPQSSRITLYQKKELHRVLP